MIKIENIDIWGFEHAIRGLRNPLNSWDKSDSFPCYTDLCGSCSQNHNGHCSYSNELYGFHVGENDLSLMRKLYKAGSEHRKYLRQIFVSMDIIAPLYWWKEFDTYKVGTVANSCSTMHKIAAKEFELDDFSHEHLYVDNLSPFCPELVLAHQIDALNFWRKRYLETKNKSDWWQLIQLLPSSYNQKRTVTMNYENVVTMIHQRTGHKLDEWNEFVATLKGLPYIKEITESE